MGMERHSWSLGNVGLKLDETKTFYHGNSKKQPVLCQNT